MFEEVNDGRQDGDWFKATACPNVTCVEVRFDRDIVGVRDSKDLLADPQATFPFLEVPADRWPLFLSEVLGESPSGENGFVFFSEATDGDVTLTTADADVSLRYDSEEWAAFRAGVTDGDFGPVHSQV